VVGVVPREPVVQIRFLRSVKAHFTLEIPAHPQLEALAFH
jgi:hypothetical protein